MFSGLLWDDSWGLTFVAEMQRILKENDLVDREEQYQQDLLNKHGQGSLVDHRPLDGLQIQEADEES
jgi:hypothetical protein